MDRFALIEINFESRILNLSPASQVFSPPDDKNREWISKTPESLFC
jgi:hypothetical protein